MKRPCLTPGCRLLTDKGSRCPEHTRAKQRNRDAIRGSAGLRGYDAEYARNRKIILADGPQCFYCGVAGARTVDHRRALADGGGNEIENMVPACMSCNSSRGAKLGNARRRW